MVEHVFPRSIMATFVAGVLMMLSPTITALQLVGESDITVKQGGTAVLACSVIDTKETLYEISWQKQTRGHPQSLDFVTITKNNGPKVNVDDDRVTFIGNFNDRNGSLELSRVTLMDEGNYTCAITLFPSGIHRLTTALNVFVPPVLIIVDDHPVWGGEEVSLATCTAAAAKPPASVSWLVGDVPGDLKTTSSSTVHDNGTVTTSGQLFGVPSREINNQLVQCVITRPGFEDQTLSFNLQIYFPPTEVKIRQQTEDSFECEAEANPAATFVWTRTDGGWPESSVTADGPTLRFLTGTSSLNGVYQCEASNQHGSKLSLLYIYVAPGHCVVWVILFILLLLFTAGVGVVWLLYRYGIFNRIPLVRNWQAVQTSSSSQNRTSIEVPEATEEGSVSL